MRAAAAALTLACATLFVAACATGSYAGVSFAPDAAESTLQSLARRAQAGDKQAQLDLGIRYEEGRGLPVDRARALRLYRKAASAGGGTVYIYSPPVGSHGQGRVIPADTGPRRGGLAAARVRLAALEGRAGDSFGGTAAAGAPGTASPPAVAEPTVREIWRTFLHRIADDSTGSPAERRLALEPGASAGAAQSTLRQRFAGRDGNVAIVIDLLSCDAPTLPHWANESCRRGGQFLRATATVEIPPAGLPGCFTGAALRAALIGEGWRMPQPDGRSVTTVRGRGPPPIVYDRGMPFEDRLRRGPHFITIRPTAATPHGCLSTSTFFAF